MKKPAQHLIAEVPRRQAKVEITNRPEDVRIKTGVTGQLLRIDPAAPPVAVRDRPQLADVRHDHFVAQFLQLCADPDRVSPGLHRDPRWSHVSKPLLNSLRGSSEASAIDHFSVLVEGTVIAPDIAKVDPDSPIAPSPSRRPSP
ncbi:hypothetical protein RBB77_13305 [Tunturibacter psychrotolerans]|uniref:Uncharacterized protein n=1 Tax=Tunturiibacter psychrotolerans TaxID=3069686 RepID=A0AAU7ZJN6_9BACT